MVSFLDECDPLSPWSRYLDCCSSDILHQFRQAGQTFAAQAKGNPVSFAVFKQCPWNHYGIFLSEQTQLALRFPFPRQRFSANRISSPCVGSQGQRGFPSANLPTDIRNSWGSSTDRGLAGESRAPFRSCSPGLSRIPVQGQGWVRYGHAPMGCPG